MNIGIFTPTQKNKNIFSNIQIAQNLQNKAKISALFKQKNISSGSNLNPRNFDLFLKSESMDLIEVYDEPSQENKDFNLIKSLVSSENDFTMEDALMTQYSHEHPITIEDLASGKNNGLFVKDTEKSQEFLEELRANGASKDIDWSRVEYDLRGIEFNSYNPIEYLEKKTDYIASRYSVLKSRIESDFTGEEQQSQMNRLNEMFDEAKHKLADSYGNLAGGYLEENGVEGQKDKISESIIFEIDKKINQYNDYIKANEDYADLNDSQDKWLLRNDGYMAAKLREVVKENGVTSTQNTEISENNNLYSMHDLNAVGKYVEQMKKGSQNAGFNDEEAMGLDFAVKAMKTDLFTKNSRISKEMAKVINDSFKGYMENAMNAIDENMKLRRENPMIEEDKYRFGDLNREAIYEVYNYTMAKYNATGDIMNSLLLGAEHGKSIYDKKVDSEEYGINQRYMNNFNSSWKNFYKGFNYKMPIFLQVSGGYHPSTLEEYTANINTFTESLKGNINDINFNGKYEDKYWK